ncbi:universal stress protein [Pseudomonas cannabina]|uniref:Universal stress protein n=3 Tax=Pseudomonas syringae group TaxID=136849 RepID=A0A3M3RSX2_PSECA|nr:MULTISPECIES: universal stress protein [Pseudomonas syringae group]KPB77819.1 Universal stress protein family protein [Pseudomonas syringae pv. maculicola]KPW17272.1 Universal stress protein family protein [Pseudomonas cannabina pv. alisalensis]MBM0141028.1 universal stress protein [Pseudomonas cannabina pv. alisalensis]QHE96719.1 universal stress protein [Pseudomonas syringae pv. maculicola str. ES4326]QQN20228.1 universal stress protein [Pseudomonas cannabina pv. alisalensis]
MVRSMLYATDLGLYAPYVTQHALALARTFNAGLYVIHVVEPMGLFAESVLQSYLGKDALLELHSQGVGAFMEAIEQRMLDGFREEMGEGHQDLSFIRTVRVIQGEPSSVILEQAQKLGVDLLVVGSHSRRVEEGGAIGRTAARVLQLSEVPIYMVPIMLNTGRR